MGNFTRRTKSWKGARLWYSMPWPFCRPKLEPANWRHFLRHETLLPTRRRIESLLPTCLPPLRSFSKAGVADDMDGGFMELKGAGDCESFVAACRKLRYWDRANAEALTSRPIKQGILSFDFSGFMPVVEAEVIPGGRLRECSLNRSEFQEIYHGKINRCSCSCACNGRF